MPRWCFWLTCSRARHSDSLTAEAFAPIARGKGSPFSCSSAERTCAGLRRLARDRRDGVRSRIASPPDWLSLDLFIQPLSAAARSSRRWRWRPSVFDPVSASSASGHGRDNPIAIILLSRSPAALLSKIEHR